MILRFLEKLLNKLLSAPLKAVILELVYFLG